jgi:hypothetical protein
MGTPGITPGAATTPNATETTAGWVGSAPNVLEFVGRFLNIKKHQQDQARVELQGAIQLSQAGWPVDPKTFSKLVKKSGLPVATDDKTLSAFFSSGVEEHQAKQGGGGSGAMTGMGSGGPPGQGGQPQASSPEHQAIQDAMGKIKSSGKPLEAGEMIALQMNALTARARDTQAKLQNTQNMTAQQKADNELQLSQLKEKAIQGDNEARGQLMRLGDIPVNIDLEKWNGMTDTQRKGMFDIIAGNESQAERAARGTRVGESMITSGRFSNPADAFKAGQIMAAGGELPSDLKAKMKPYTFNELSEEALLGSTLQQMGVPSDKLPGVLSAAQAGGLENALPTGMKPLAFKAWELEEQRGELEKLRYEKELEIAQRMASAEARKGITDEQKHWIDTFKSLTEMNKAHKGSVPDSLMKGAQAKAAKAMGMDVKEVQSWYDWITGGSHLEFTPHLSDDSKSTVDRMTDGDSGQQQPPNVDPSVGQYLQGMSK